MNSSRKVPISAVCYLSVARALLLPLAIGSDGVGHAEHCRENFNGHAAVKEPSMEGGVSPSSPCQAGASMIRLLAAPLALLLLTDQAMAGSGWELEKGVKAPSYALAEPTSTDLNIDTVVLSCEQGADRRGLQLRLFLSDAGPLAPLRKVTLKDDPTVEIAIDGVSHRAELFFADDSVLVADSTDGPVPMLSEKLIDALQAGRTRLSGVAGEARHALLSRTTGTTRDSVRTGRTHQTGGSGKTCKIRVVTREAHSSLSLCGTD